MRLVVVNRIIFCVRSADHCAVRNNVFIDACAAAARDIAHCHRDIRQSFEVIDSSVRRHEHPRA